MMGSSPLTFNPVAISNGESANYDQSPPVSPSSDIPSNPVPLQPVPLNIPPPPPLPNSGGGQINSGP
jgi:hypothetical protein